MKLTFTLKTFLSKFFYQYLFILKIIFCESKAELIVTLYLLFLTHSIMLYNELKGNTHLAPIYDRFWAQNLGHVE